MGRKERAGIDPLSNLLMVNALLTMRERRTRGVYPFDPYPNETDPGMSHAGKPASILYNLAAARIH